MFSMRGYFRVESSSSPGGRMSLALSLCPDLRGIDRYLMVGQAMLENRLLREVVISSSLGEVLLTIV